MLINSYYNVNKFIKCICFFSNVSVYNSYFYKVMINEVCNLISKLSGSCQGVKYSEHLKSTMFGILGYHDNALIIHTAT